MFGGDHQFPDSNLPELIRKINPSLDDIKVIQSNLEDYTKSVRKEIGNPENLYGEQRGGVKYAPILPGVLSSRVYLKQKNEKSQNLLERRVEPFSSINLLLGSTYRRSIIKGIWKYLLQNHAHDSICGCGIDDVHLDMERRFSWVEQIGKHILKGSLNGIIQNMNIPHQSIVVFNPLNWERGGRVNAPVEFEDGEEFILTDGDDKVPYEIISKKVVNKVVVSPQIHIEKRTKMKIGFEAKAIPSVGYKTYIIKKGKITFSNQLQSGDRWAENENLKIELDKNGTLSILDKNKNEIYKGLNYFEDSVDSGDEYNYSPPSNNMSYSGDLLTIDLHKC
ncbi:MAG: hypothetical protein COT45_05900 [bacterium (Candidatus Stahlbacteria) CG08_land_8_20_14_0_20_40_26]|nr:MAG: hypothetical protein COX49_09915 [bacterium (Candidatus Stahlbacteria) CG23_combo_of_CG06-09_8_20_14_all_40_9]PIS23579.1 MAG: hypothetical protein COT45_05900 [bacterium (Candidatus Stahlbacteria) CG08_land_8_20_14_0_20_40_26]